MRKQDRLEKRRKKPWLRLVRVIIATITRKEETSTAGPEKIVGVDMNTKINVLTTLLSGLVL